MPLVPPKGQWDNPTATTGGREQHAAHPPTPRPQHKLAAVSAPAGEKRAPNWEERTQPSNWEHGRPTHGGETSPNRTQSTAQGDHKVASTAATTNAADAKRAISNQTPPSVHEVPRNSARARAAPRRWEVPATGVAAGL